MNKNEKENEMKNEETEAVGVLAVLTVDGRLTFPVSVDNVPVGILLDAGQRLIEMARDVRVNIGRVREPSE